MVKTAASFKYRLGVMSVMARTHTIHIIDGDPQTSESIGYMLCSHPFNVRHFSDMQKFNMSHDFKDGDVLLVDLNHANPDVFKFLHDLIYSPRRPKVIITLSRKSILNDSDQFPSGNVKVLFHPLVPGELVKAVSAFFEQSRTQ